MIRLALGLMIALAAPAASAQTPPIIAYPPQNDTVSMNLALEEWVETQTARVELSVDAAMPGSDAGKARSDMLKAVGGLSKGAEWRFTRFDRNQDSSGLEHWFAVLEARLPETQLGGLSDRAKQASRPGLQIGVQTVDFTPTLAEVEAAKAKLRGEIYKRVNESLAQLNQAEPNRKYRIMHINFGAPVAVPMPGQPRMMAMAAKQEDVSGGAAIQLSQKVQLQANVTFAAIAPTQ